MRPNPRHYSGDERYARGAAKLLGAWASLENITAGDDQKRLQAGQTGVVASFLCPLFVFYIESHSITNEIYAWGGGTWK